jgi:succinyl-CoA synthetase beta subunit
MMMEETMGSISIQGVDEQLTALLKQQAAKARTSVNQFIIDTLKKHVGLEKEKQFSKEYDDLDHLFGSWSEEEFSEIQGTISSERRIDQELWQ